VNASAATIHQGGLLFNGQCASCPGINAVAGPMPDLRYAAKGVHDQFEAIVLGEALASLGMPSFKKILAPAQVPAIQTYILSRAAESAKHPSEGPTSGESLLKLWGTRTGARTCGKPDGLMIT
jgi:mono/diheme cytochrome c family protein